MRGSAPGRPLRRTVRWCPDHAPAHRTLAEYVFRLDRLPEAIATIRRAAALAPESQEYNHFVGILQHRTGDFAAAAEAQTRSPNSTPPTPPRATSVSRC